LNPRFMGSREEMTANSQRPSPTIRGRGASRTRTGDLGNERVYRQNIEGEWTLACHLYLN
jgi:hypothetical protein